MAISETEPSALQGRGPWTMSIRAWFDRFVQRRQQRRALAELRGLGAHTLKDLAIDRSEIRSLVHGGPHGRRRPHSPD